MPETKTVFSGSSCCCIGAAVLGLLSLAAPAAAQSGSTHWMAGRVAESGTGVPVAGASVRLDGPTVPAAITADDGTWRIGPLAPGVYELKIEHIAYAPLERRVHVPLEDEPLRLTMTARPLPLDALVVTAGRRTQRLADAAVATELVTRREIRETGATDLAAILTERTGLELAGGHPVGEGVMIQGMSSERVLVLMDGQPFNGRISGSIDVSRIPTSMIERVEVVKGPQSTLYGSEAMGGVVNVITREPAVSVWTPSLTATAGNRGRMDVSGTVMGGTGSLTALADVGRRSIELAPGFSGEAGAVATRWDGLAKVGWRSPVEGLRVEASGMLLDERQRWKSGQLYQFADNVQWSGRLGGVFERGRHRVAHTVYLTAFDHLSRRGTAAEPVEGTGEREMQRLAEAELLYGLAVGDHSLDVGVEARREAIESDRVIGGDRTYRMLESFVQSTVAEGRFTFVPGLRASWSEPWGMHWTPRVAAMYRPVPEVALRVSVGEGFRAPGFKELYMEFLNVGPGFGYTVRGNPHLLPEVSRNLTGSVEWAGARTWLRLQAFANRFDDFIETRAVGDSSGVTVYTYGNVDDGTTHGGELEAGAALGPWRFEGGVSLLRAERTETGESLLGRPRDSMRAMVAWAHPAGVRASLTGIRTGRTAMSRTGSETVWRQPYTRFDVRVAKSLPGDLELVAGIDNLMDRTNTDWPGFTGRHLYTSVSWRASGTGSDRE